MSRLRALIRHYSRLSTLSAFCSAHRMWREPLPLRPTWLWLLKRLIPVADYTGLVDVEVFHEGHLVGRGRKPV